MVMCFNLVLIFCFLLAHFCYASYPHTKHVFPFHFHIDFLDENPSVETSSSIFVYFRQSLYHIGYFQECCIITTALVNRYRRSPSLIFLLICRIGCYNTTWRLYTTKGKVHIIITWYYRYSSPDKFHV